jgi:hypothetical protein
MPAPVFPAIAPVLQVVASVLMFAATVSAVAAHSFSMAVYTSLPSANLFDSAANVLALIVSFNHVSVPEMHRADTPGFHFGTAIAFYLGRGCAPQTMKLFSTINKRGYYE